MLLINQDELLTFQIEWEKLLSQQVGELKKCRKILLSVEFRSLKYLEPEVSTFKS
jgi:hypothetical protein